MLRAPITLEYSKMMLRHKTAHWNSQNINDHRINYHILSVPLNHFNSLVLLQLACVVMEYEAQPQRYIIIHILEPSILLKMFTPRKP